jgi:hypothetical protein
MNRSVNLYCDSKQDMIKNIDNININNLQKIVNYSVDHLYFFIPEYIKSDDLKKYFAEIYNKIRPQGKVIIRFLDFKEASKKYINNIIDDATLFSLIQNKKSIMSLNLLYSLMDNENFAFVKLDKEKDYYVVILERIK